MHYVLLLRAQTRHTESNPQCIGFLEIKGEVDDAGKHYKKIVSKPSKVTDISSNGLFHSMYKL